VSKLLCLIRHRWNALYAEQPMVSLPEGWARMFGNTILREQCGRCGKRRERPMYASQGANR
jgi:hypothetical protein